MIYNSNATALSWCNKIYLSRIQVSECCTSTWVAVWGGTWLISTTSWPLTDPILNSPELKFNAASWQPVPPLRPVFFLIMIPSSSLICAPPFCTSPSFAAAENHSRTFMGTHWASVRWVEVWLMLQASHCHTCKFASYLTSALPLAHLGAEAKLVLIHSCLHSLAGCQDLPVLPVMSKLRQRMRSRRGRSWGKTSH